MLQDEYDDFFFFACLSTEELTDSECPCSMLTFGWIEVFRLVLWKD